jgi:AraC family transcriptional regulator
MNTCLASPAEWEAALGGTQLSALPADRARPFQLGIYRFGALNQRVEAPPVDHHYVSFTIRGHLEVERQLSGGIERAALHDGWSLIMSAGQSNVWRWNRPTDELHLWISPAWLAELAVSSGAPSTGLVDRFPFEDASLRSMVTAVFAELRRPGRAPALFDEVAAQAIALQLLARHCSASVRLETAQIAPRRVRRVMAQMLERLSEDLPLSELASQAGVSRAHFARSFRVATGESPHRWLTARRMERACDLLVATELSVAEVAGEVGYASASHFCAVFRRAKRCSPVEYRRITRGSAHEHDIRGTISTGQGLLDD